MSQGKFSNFVGLFCEIGSFTIIDRDFWPLPCTSLELDLYLIIISAFTNKIEDLEVVNVNCSLFSVICLWCVYKVLTSSLDSALTCTLRNLEFISPFVKIYNASFVLKQINLFFDSFEILFSLLSVFPKFFNSFQCVSCFLLNIFVRSKQVEIVASFTSCLNNLPNLVDSIKIIWVFTNKFFISFEDSLHLGITRNLGCFNLCCFFVKFLLVLCSLFFGSTNDSSFCIYSLHFSSNHFAEASNLSRDGATFFHYQSSHLFIAIDGLLGLV